MKSLFLTCLPLTFFGLNQQETLDPNPSDRFGIKASYNAYFTGEAVWFKPLNEEVVSKNPSGQTFFDNQFQLGLRLSFGINTNYDNWDTYATYTALRYSHSNQAALITQELSTSGTTKLNYDVNLADFDLGRMCKVSKKLTLRPHLGVRAFWLTQKQRLSVSLEDASYFKKINSTLVGLQGGLDSIWKFSSGFSLFGNLGLSSLINSQKIKSSNPTSIFISNSSTSIIPALDFSIGLRWDINFSNDMYHFAFIAGYEQHVYFNINQTFAIDQELNQLELPQSLQSPDFALQGLSLGARFDF